MWRGFALLNRAVDLGDVRIGGRWVLHLLESDNRFRDHFKRKREHSFLLRNWRIRDSSMNARFSRGCCAKLHAGITSSRVFGWEVTVTVISCKITRKFRGSGRYLVRKFICVPCCELRILVKPGLRTRDSYRKESDISFPKCSFRYFATVCQSAWNPIEALEIEEKTNRSIKSMCRFTSHDESWISLTTTKQRSVLSWLLRWPLENFAVLSSRIHSYIWLLNAIFRFYFVNCIR